jgi:hypothetical protein
MSEDQKHNLLAWGRLTSGHVSYSLHGLGEE